MGPLAVLIMATSIVGTMGFIPHGSIGEKVCILYFIKVETSKLNIQSATEVMKQFVLQTGSTLCLVTL